MTIADFKEKIARARGPGDHAHYPPKVEAILRTPGDEHIVSAGDLSATRGDKEPKLSNGKSRPCAMECGMPAAPDDVCCEDCRAEVDKP